MEIVCEKINKSGENEQGTPYRVRLELPRFPEGNENGQNLNKFYDRLAEILESTAMKQGCTVIAELHRTACTEKLYSLYIDLLWYRGRELLDYRRISDTRDQEGFMLLLPKKLKKHLPRDGGWYYDGTACVIYESKFTPGAEQGVRRSSYYKFMEEKRFPLTL